MKTKLVGGTIGSAISMMGMAISTEQLEQITSIICSVAGVLIVIITSLIVPFVKKYQEAKKDGVIDEKEKQELKDIITSGGKEVKDKIDEVRKDK